MRQNEAKHTCEYNNSQFLFKKASLSKRTTHKSSLGVLLVACFHLNVFLAVAQQKCKEHVFLVEDCHIPDKQHHHSCILILNQQQGSCCQTTNLGWSWSSNVRDVM